MSKVVWNFDKKNGEEFEMRRIGPGAWTFYIDDGIEGCSFDIAKEELYGLYAAIKNELQIAGD